MLYIRRKERRRSTFRIDLCIISLFSDQTNAKSIFLCQIMQRILMLMVVFIGGHPGTDLTGASKGGPQYLGYSTKPDTPKFGGWERGKTLGAKSPNSVPKSPFQKTLAILSEKYLLRNAIKSKNQIKGFKECFLSFFRKIVS